MKKYLLTSFAAMLVAGPAMADPVDVSTFPNVNAVPPEYMQTNTRYLNAAVSDNMAGVYADNATVYAIAMWDNYASSGQYYDAATDTIKNCPSNYPSSAEGAGSIYECFAPCTSVSSLSSAKTVIGGVYRTDGNANATSVGPGQYGDDNTCLVLECNNGYHLNTTGTAPETHYTAATSDGKGAWVGSDGVYWTGRYGISNLSQDFTKISSPNTFAYSSDGVHGYTMQGNAKCLSTSISTNANVEMISGIATMKSAVGKTAGKYCWCQFNGYVDTTDSNKIKHFAARWVGLKDLNSQSSCQENCAYECANAVVNGSVSTTATFRSVMAQSGLATGKCDANTIKFSWQGAPSGEGTQSVQYGGDITTPTTTPTKSGHVFKGWMFNSAAPSGN